MRGECICCSRVARCSETSVEKLLSSYTCALFAAVDEPVYRARLQVMQVLGEKAAAEAILERPRRLEGENVE